MRIILPPGIITCRRWWIIWHKCFIFPQKIRRVMKKKKKEKTRGYYEFSEKWIAVKSKSPNPLSPSLRTCFVSYITNNRWRALYKYVADTKWQKLTFLKRYQLPKKLVNTKSVWNKFKLFARVTVANSNLAERYWYLLCSSVEKMCNWTKQRNSARGMELPGSFKHANI